MLYRKAFLYVYAGKVAYTTATDTIIDSDIVFAIIQGRASKLIENLYIRISPDKEKPNPEFDFTPQDQATLANLVVNSTEASTSMSMDSITDHTIQ